MSDPPAPATATTPADAVSQALSRLAADTRRQTAYYGNVRGLPGSSARPRRLLSDFGFPDNRSFSYVVPATALVVPHDPPRPVSTVTVHPYGLDSDLRRLTSRRPADRRVHTSGGDAVGGVRPLADNADVYVSAALEDDTYAPAKTARLLNNLTSARVGPAYHFIISRRGDIIVGAVLDHETTASAEDGDVTVDVALEGAFALRRADHEANRYDRALIELPYTPLQVLVLSVLIAKLRTAYPTVPAALGTGIRYDWRGDLYRLAPQLNFSSGAWRGVSPFDHSLSDDPAFSHNLTTVAPFDLATQVFLTDQTPPPVATRSVAQTAISTADTAGEQSVLLANYATLAGPERANAMQSAPRVRFFVERINAASRDADNASGSSADTAAAGQRNPLTPAASPDASTYDFQTGRWSDDGNTY